jgi:hypothetical protein
MHTTPRMIHTGTQSPRRSRAAWMARTAAFTVLTAATAICLQAQSILETKAEPSAQSQPSLQTAAPRPALDFHAAMTAPMDLSVLSGESATSSSSSSASTDPAIDSERLNLSSESNQPPPRRRYGRPRYNDNSHNADGSKKLTFELGGGFTVPVGGTHDYSKLNYKFQVGAGRNFNKTFGVLAQFDWDNFGIQTNTLNSLLATYNSLGASDQSGNPLSQIGGNTHIWSFSINPIINILQSESTGVYVVGGVGFYHKATNITTPSVGTYCDYYYGCYQYPANASIDKYNSNAPGFSGGLGFTYRGSRFSGVKFFTEARYVYIANSERPYYDGTKGTQLSPTYFNVFPQNSAKTSYIPVTFGVRF